MKDLPAENTDKHLFYENASDVGYSPSCHMTIRRELGIQVGGNVVVTSLRAWFNSIKRENSHLERIEKLKSYTAHRTNCDSLSLKGCNCGLSELIKE